ncbi:hypothetical protein 8G_00010 [Ralstonia phage Hyacinthe]|uniref:Uncharacterized protein n=3 Tax=Rahariannevirus raharianne TaxID=2846050 RepID=A0A7G5BBC5_9CAUD|nr:hypothetical protein KMC43_gp29 [Ralstonia phage Raharianne]QMV32404.1 hypothetical protein U2_00029 [Ralstonia phage Albius]QMV33442.1 hypothetical protein 8G_00010 [Ralstonia phage Hyacinthe]QMV33598.1 hypothetical protein Y2_00029 [Ralstonia phage Raharianne]
MARAKKEDDKAADALPDSILLDESIGWMENGILRQFHEGTHVTNPVDVAALIQHGARYLEVSK